MGEMTLAAAERLALCDLMDRVGPDAPTLCGDWTTRDLAAHLVLRDGRLDAAPGILVPPLAGYTARIQRRIAQRPWPELVAQVRSGPPWWSPLNLPGLGNNINAVEFFVHHEDVRRAQQGWTPRADDLDRAAKLWTLLVRAAGLCYRKSPVGVVLRRPDGVQHIVRPGGRAVTLIGSPEELLLHAYGRDQVVIEAEGDQDDILSLEGSERRV